MKTGVFVNWSLKLWGEKLKDEAEEGPKSPLGQPIPLPQPEPEPATQPAKTTAVAIPTTTSKEAPTPFTSKHPTPVASSTSQINAQPTMESAPKATDSSAHLPSEFISFAEHVSTPAIAISLVVLLCCTAFVVYKWLLKRRDPHSQYEFVPLRGVSETKAENNASSKELVAAFGEADDDSDAGGLLFEQSNQFSEADYNDNFSNISNDYAAEALSRNSIDKTSKS